MISIIVNIIFGIQGSQRYHIRKKDTVDSN